MDIQGELSFPNAHSQLGAVPKFCLTPVICQTMTYDNKINKIVTKNINYYLNMGPMCLLHNEYYN